MLTFYSMYMPLPLGHITSTILLPLQVKSRWLIFYFVCGGVCACIWAQILYVLVELDFVDANSEFAYPDDNSCVSIPSC